MRSIFTVVVLLGLLIGCREQSSNPTVITKGYVFEYQTPDEVYKSLFTDLHASGLFKDGKSISDAVPKFEPKEILEKYEASRGQEDFDLQDFFNANFAIASPPNINFIPDPDRAAVDHVKHLWPLLSRPADKPLEGSSLIPLPNPYIVPGGRFNEVYYWDSYFTMLGLKEHGELEMIENVLDNFTFLIDTLGHIPNGNRTYFKTRSQPPFFSLMVQLLADVKGKQIYQKYEKALMKEYLFWTKGANTPGAKPFKHAVSVKGGKLSRYYDNSIKPRQEMHQDDVELLAKSGRSAKSLFTDVRAACESGWDFSSRWFKDHKTLETINTSNILP
ncbi:MAG: trehalase family glycosidase, partial [Bacteroidota bacterium]